MSEVDWSPRARPEPLAEGRADVWKISLAPPAEEIARLKWHLSDDELARAERFRFDRHRHRFIVGRGALRELLGDYLGCEPTSLEFEYNEQGKPSLPEGPSFNLSHTEDVGLLAVAGRGRVGVDIESCRKKIEELEIVDRFFSEREVEAFRSLPPEHHREAFFTIWTRKEAYIKALGGGLSIPLGAFDVSFDPAEPPRILRAHADDSEGDRWSLFNLEPGEDCAAALLLEGGPWQVACYELRRA